MFKALKTVGEQDNIDEDEMNFNKKLKNHKNLYDYLCNTIEEKNEFEKIFNLYDNEYDIITEYRKDRVLRKKNQYTSEGLKNIINTQDFNRTKDCIQRMFGDFISDEDINNFLNRTKKETNIIDVVVSKLIDKHQAYPLEKFHNLLLLIE